MATSATATTQVPNDRTVTQQSYLPGEIAPYAQDVLGRASQLTALPYQPFTGGRVAEFSGQQQQAFDQLGGLQSLGSNPIYGQLGATIGQQLQGFGQQPGVGAASAGLSSLAGTSSYNPAQAATFGGGIQAQGGGPAAAATFAPSQAQAATGFSGAQATGGGPAAAATFGTPVQATGAQAQGAGPAQAASFGTPATVQGAAVAGPITSQAASFGGTGNNAQAANVQASGLTPADFAQLSTFMSPYQQGVTDIAKREATRQNDMQAIARNANLVSKGAFGGTRQAIMDAEAARNLNQNLSDLQIRGSQDAYTQGVRALEAQRAYDTGVGTTNAGFQQQANLSNADRAQQLGISNAGLQQQTNLANQNAGQQVLLANAGYQQQANLANQAAQLQAQGANAGFQQQANLSNADREQQLGITNANLLQQLGITNAGFTQQAGLANAGFQQQANLANADRDQQLGIANAGFTQQAGLANQANQQATNLANAGFEQQAGTANAGFQQQANLSNADRAQQLGITNAQLAQQAGLANAGFEQQTNLANQSAQQQAYAQQLAALQAQGNLGIAQGNQQLSGLQTLGSLQGQLLNQEAGIQNADLQRIAALQAAGGQQQALDQKALDTNYQNFLDARGYDMNQLTQYSNILRNIPTASNQVAQTQTEGPSTASQLGGILGSILTQPNGPLSGVVGAGANYLSGLFN